MDWLAQLGTEKLLVFTLILTRTSGLLAAAPGLSHAAIPVKARALLAVMLAVLILPVQWQIRLPPIGSPVEYVLLLGAELVIGLTLGLGLAVFFSGIQLAGELAGRISGLLLADVFDPSSGQSVPVFSQFFLMLATAVFLLLGGHRVLVAGLLDTFATVPPGNMPATSAVADTFVFLIAQSFVLAMRAAAPIVVALLLSTLVLGLLSRTLPQLNILAVGFGFNALVGLATLALALGAALWVFQDQVAVALERLFELLDTPLRPELFG